MPQRANFADLDPQLPSQQRELAEAVRGLLLRIGLSCQRTEERMLKEAGPDGYLSRSVLSDLANGRRKRAPREEPLRALYDLALNSQGTTGAVGSWEELDSLRQALSPLPPEGQDPAAVCPACGAATPLEGAVAGAGPAGSPAAVTVTVVPVPPHDVDRHNSGAADFSWPAAEDLALYLAAGNLERANGLMRHVGTEVHPTETADAVVSCRDLGLLEAKDTIIGQPATGPSGMCSRFSTHSISGIGVLMPTRSLNAHLPLRTVDPGGDPESGCRHPDG
ncbi:hypothetical protein GXW82_24345 [Streptacidiphilus sp. 4-A2]|nr:hypothetical protein [Streptacidiphilus sp. 4-A2]